MAVSQEDYDLCDRENANLRDALAWCASRLSEEDKVHLETNLARLIERGGVTGTQAEDDLHEAQIALKKLADHVEPISKARSIGEVDAIVFRNPWLGRLDMFLSAAREQEPKHPVMRRIGGQPNVFAPVRGNT